MRKLIDTESPRIVDGGANRGQSVSKFLTEFDSPIIYAFEPRPDMSVVLRNRFDEDNIEVHEKAIGPKKDIIDFNITESSLLSSALDPSLVGEYFGEDGEIQEVIEAEQIRLDEFFETDKTLDLVKLDLEGYELDALYGAEGHLNNISIIYTEVEFIPHYKNQALFSDIDTYLRENEFQLFNIYNLVTDPSGQLRQGDAIYINRSFYDFEISERKVEISEQQNNT
jgi:FkbM family methyltransferase